MTSLEEEKLKIKSSQITCLSITFMICLTIVITVSLMHDYNVHRVETNIYGRDTIARDYDMRHYTKEETNER